MKAILSNAALVALLVAALLTNMPALVSISIVLGWILALVIAFAGIACVLMTFFVYANQDDEKMRSAGDKMRQALTNTNRFVSWTNCLLTAAMIVLLAAMGAHWTAVAFGFAWLIIATPCVWLSRGLLSKMADEASAQS